MCVTYASLVLLFRLTNAPLGLFAYSELDLTLVYAGLVLTLRFRHLLVFIGFGFVLSLAAILTKPGVPEGLTAAFSLQMASASIFVVISNYVVETRRCQAFVDTLRARARAHVAETETLQMERRSLTDPLTGLPNRRALDQRMDAAFAEAEEVVVMIVDIDHFKPYNDILGHVEGDRCLKTVAATFATVAAEHDAFAPGSAARNSCFWQSERRSSRCCALPAG
jgi:predicted signal transduction protein with EAL and GGDEF domain